MPTWLKFAIATLIWGTTWIVIKSQVTFVAAPWAVCYRMLLASILGVIYAITIGQFRALSAATHLRLAGYGFFQFGLNLVLIYEAQKHVPAGLVAVGFSLMVVGNPLIARLLLGQPMARPLLGAAVLGITGVACLFWPEIETMRVDDVAVLALAMVVLGTLSASVGNLFPALHSLRGLSGLVMNGWGMAYGAALTAMYASIVSGPPTFSFDPTFVAGLVFLSLLGSVVTFGLYFDVIREWGPGRAAYTTVLTPVIALSISTAVENYHWTPLAIFGAALALTGAALAVRVTTVRRTAP